MHTLAHIRHHMLIFVFLFSRVLLNRRGYRHGQFLYYSGIIEKLSNHGCSDVILFSLGYFNNYAD